MNHVKHLAQCPVHHRSPEKVPLSSSHVSPTPAPPFAHEETESQAEEQLASTHALCPTPSTQQRQSLAAVGKVPGPEPSARDIC